jgi:hypothetical protein
MRKCKPFAVEKSSKDSEQSFKYLGVEEFDFHGMPSGGALANFLILSPD